SGPHPTQALHAPTSDPPPLSFHRRGKGRKIRQKGTKKDRPSKTGGLKKIMPACVDKTPAHKRDISERIKFFEVSQGIQKANVLGEQTSAIGLALPGKLQAARLE